MPETTVSTGYTCPVSGIYYCRTHPSSTITLSKGETAPPCNTSGGGSHGTTWVLKIAG